MAKKQDQPVDAADKPARMPRTPEQVARHKAIRERFQREKPSLEELVTSGEYNEPIPMEEFLSIRQVVFALRKAREAAGLSLAAVAERTGIDKGALSRIETGQHLNPTVTTLSRYAQALGKRWVWSLEDECGEGESRADIHAAVSDSGPMVDEESTTPSQRGKSATALTAQIRTIHEILAQRAKQLPPPASRVTQPVESGVEIREKGYVVHFTDAFEANLTDLPPDGDEKEPNPDPNLGAIKFGSGFAPFSLPPFRCPFRCLSWFGWSGS